MPKILIIRLSSIGDIFHTFTVLPDIKKALPNCQIDWLVDESFKSVAQLSPLIDNVISIPLRKWKKNKFTWILNLIKFKNTLSKTKYDYIIDTQGLIKSAFLAKLLFNGKIYGLDKSSAREPIASLFYNYSFKVCQDNVAVIRLRGLIAKIFKLEHDLSDFSFEVLRQNLDINSKYGYILFLHGTSKDNKKWPLEDWITLSNWILTNTKYDIILTYSNTAEFEFANKLKATINDPRVKIIDKLDFLKLTDLIANAKLIIGVDTGFTHMANLLKKPTLAIYLHSKPGYVGMLESHIAHNFGGYKKQVKPAELIEFINHNNLV